MPRIQMLDGFNRGWIAFERSRFSANAVFSVCYPWAKWEVHSSIIINATQAVLRWTNGASGPVVLARVPDAAFATQDNIEPALTAEHAMRIGNALAVASYSIVLSV